MTYPEKQKRYKTFLKEWGARLEKVPSILGYLSYYPNLFPGLKKVNLIGTDELHEYQLEWVSLVAQFNNPIETTYFRNYWVPIQTDEIDIFIDLSTDDYPIFASIYFMGKPYQWYNRYIVKSIPDLLINIDNPTFSLENYKRINEENRQKKFDEIYEDYDELGFAGKQELDEPLDISRRHGHYKLEDNTLTITQVSPLNITLLPLHTALKINDINAFHNRYDNAKPRIKTVKGFAHLIVGANYREVSHYNVTLSNNRKCYARYENSTITIRHHNLALLNKVIEQLPGRAPDEIPF